MATLLLVPLAALLGFAGYAALVGWWGAGEAEIGFHGIVALVAGSVLTLLVTALLVGLMIHSRRRGYDEAQAAFDPRRPPRNPGAEVSPRDRGR